MLFSNSLFIEKYLGHIIIIVLSIIIIVIQEFLKNKKNSRNKELVVYLIEKIKEKINKIDNVKSSLLLIPNTTTQVKDLGQINENLAIIQRFVSLYSPISPLSTLGDLGFFVDRIQFVNENIETFIYLKSFVISKNRRWRDARRLLKRIIKNAKEINCRQTKKWWQFL